MYSGQQKSEIASGNTANPNLITEHISEGRIRIETISGELTSLVRVTISVLGSSSDVMVVLERDMRCGYIRGNIHVGSTMSIVVVSILS